ncbi:ATP-binding protein [Ancylothrix sp. C2]|uniref:MHYT domain-containing protein n=1 Tax=Ancylothrix sp. D3o TaxID=2953691 RepID=UPI0021BA58FF|nr:MHYT domain-containing protein [Ancylothrix sp. D3o]MCT7950600.1 ATP-binding protein [Ancylothrix sp. D3o]
MLTHTYDLHLVALSIIIATVASHTALDLAGLVRTGKKKKIGWLIGGALAMGTGIWSMHFVGMLAFHLSVPVRYNLPCLLLSLFAPVLASAGALELLSRENLGRRQIVAGGTLMGLAIATMHYTGMAAMRMPAHTHYNSLLVGLSVVIACLASYTALWLGLQLRNKTAWNWQKLASPLLMGGGISAMHYTGMAAAHFTPNHNAPVDPLAIDTSSLPIAITYSTLIILGLTLFKSRVDRRLGSSQESLEMLQKFIRKMQVGVIFLNTDLKIILSNSLAENLLNLSPEELHNKNAFDPSWGLINEDGSPIQAHSNPAITALTTRASVTNIIYGIDSQPNQEYLDNIKSIRWLLINANPMLTEEGEIDGIICTFTDITQRKETENALSGSEAKLQKLSANIPGMIYQFCLGTDGSFSFPFVSSGCYELFEITAENIQENANLLMSGIHPEDAVFFVESISVSAQTLQPWRWEGRFITRRGKIKWFKAASRPEKQANGEIIWDGVIIDITDQKEIEEELLKQNQRIQLLADTNLKIRESLQLETILQTTVDQVLKILQTDRVVIYRFWPDGSGKVVTEAVVGDYPVILGKQIIDTCFNEIYIEQYRQGRVRSIADIESGEIHQCHAESLKQFAIKANLVVPIIQSPEKISGFDMQTSQNESQNHLWGLLIAHQCGTTRRWTSVETELMQQLANQLSIALAKAELIDKERKVSKQLVEQNIALEKTLKELQQTQAQLVQQEKMASLGQLVAGVAHEINNPVSFIAGNITYARNYVQNLLHLLKVYENSYPQPSQDVLEAAEEIDIEFIKEDLPKTLSSMEVGADRIRKIVLSLRNFSRLDQADKKRVDIHEGIDSTLLILQHRLKDCGRQGGIEIIKNYGVLPPVECYPGQLNQVFMNILSNAIDALEDQPYPKQITISTEIKNSHPSKQICLPFNDSRIKADSGLRLSGENSLKPQFYSQSSWVLIRISDNGAGMPEDTQKRLFDPFFTTKPPGKGTGLGLSISYQIIVERHGGKLFCYSTVGEGTEFLIEIPMLLPGLKKI